MIDMNTIYRNEHDALMEALEWANSDQAGFVGFVSGITVMVERMKKILEDTNNE